MKKNSKRRMFSALLILFLLIQMTVQADTGTKASTQSAAGGTGAGKAGTTTSKLPAATTKTPWSTSGTVDGVAGA